MTFRHGKDAALYVGDFNLSPFLTGADLAVDLDTADSTTWTATWKQAIPGTLAATLNVQGYYDPDVDTLVDVTVTPGVVTYLPGGHTAGDGGRLLEPHQVGYAESSPVGGVVAFTASFASGVAGLGTLLRDGEDTNTTTGGDQDDGALSTTGWTAHLHVLAVDGGSWVVKLQDAATTDWADVTGGAFTAATVPTSQRLTGAAGATLRRHVRYVATRTGGAGGDGITIVLAYARNN